jgi:hypothetical protein
VVARQHIAGLQHRPSVNRELVARPNGRNPQHSLTGSAGEAGTETLIRCQSAITSFRWLDDVTLALPDVVFSHHDGSVAELLRGLANVARSIRFIRPCLRSQIPKLKLISHRMPQSVVCLTASALNSSV